MLSNYILKELQIIAKEISQFNVFPHRISVLFGPRRDFVVWKLVGKVKMNDILLYEVFGS